MNKIPILVIVFFSIGFGAGWWIANRFIVPEIQIVEKTKTLTRVLKQLQQNDYTELWDCYKNPISIDGVIVGDSLRVCATDDCKESKRDFVLKARVNDEKKNLIVGNVSYSFDFHDI